QSAIWQQPAVDVGGSRCRVQKICERAHVAVGQECARGRVLAQRCRSGYRGAVNRSEAKIQTSQHLVKQRRIAAGARDVESVENSILENVDVIQWNTAPEFGSFASDVAGFKIQICRKLTLDRKVPVLDVGICAITVEALHRLRAVRQWNG